MLDVVDAVEQIEELQYVYQRIGFQCFSETLFEDAGNSFFEGNLDPRLLISYYPDLRGSLFTADDTLNVYAGVASRMPQDVSVDDLSKSFILSSCHHHHHYAYIHAPALPFFSASSCS